MRRTLILTAIIAFAYMVQAQDAFTESFDHRVSITEEWKGVKNIHAAWVMDT